MSFFDTCFDRLIKAEGEFTDDERDSGNWTGGRVGVGTLLGTKYGIAANTYPDLDIRNLTLDQAKAIYYRDWWLKAGADFLPQDMVFQLWQFAINAGMPNAIRVLQRALGVAADGVVGPVTISAVQKIDKKDLPLRFIAYALKHYTSLTKFSTYGRGWTNRSADALLYAAEDN
jgi:lysozyme family protein